MYSVVCKGGGMQIRARNREHLEALKRRYKIILDKIPIDETPQGDYGWRMTVSLEQWITVSGLLAADIDYPNFKDAARDANVDNRYLNILHRIWWMMFSYQSYRKSYRKGNYYPYQKYLYQKRDEWTDSAPKPEPDFDDATEFDYGSGGLEDL
jgi:hypothetical protein